MIDPNRAAAELAQIAANKVLEQQALDQMKQITDQATFGKYTGVQAAIRTGKAYEEGRIKTTPEAVSYFREVLNQEEQAFVRTIQPGYRRTQAEPYLPADQEIKDYCAERRNAQNELKEEGKRISGIHSR